MSGFTKIIGVSLDNITKIVGINAENSEKVIGVSASDGGGGNIIPGTFLEEEKGHDPTFTDSGTQSNSGLAINLQTDAGVSYDSGTGETTNTEFTISWWLNLANTSNNTTGNKGVFGRRNSGSEFALEFNGASASAFAARLTYRDNNGSRISRFNNSISASIIATWTHFAIRIKEESSTLKVRLFVNGNPEIVGRVPLGHRFLPSTSEGTGLNFGSLGGSLFSTKSITGEFDSIQIGDGVALTDDQISAIAGQSDRQMSIETAAQL